MLLLLGESPVTNLTTAHLRFSTHSLKPPESKRTTCGLRQADRLILPRWSSIPTGRNTGLLMQRRVRPPTAKSTDRVLVVKRCRTFRVGVLEVSSEKRAAQVRLQVSDSANMQSFGEAQLLVWIEIPPEEALASRFRAGALSIRQLVIVTLSGILREVLDELPIVSLGVVEVHALAVRMCIRRCGVSISGRLHSVAQRLDVVDLIGEGK